MAKSKWIWLRICYRCLSFSHQEQLPFCTPNSAIFSLFSSPGLCLSCSPLPPPYHTNVPAAINSFFIISFILPAPFKQTPALQARLRPRLAFSSSFNPQTFIFSPSVTANWSIFLPVSYFSLRLRHLLIVFQILSSHGGQKKSKSANSASNTISICPVRLWMKIQRPGNSPDCTREEQQRPKTLVWASPTISSETPLIFEAIAVQSQINHNTELFQNTRKTLVSTGIPKLLVSPFNYWESSVYLFSEWVKCRTSLLCHSWCLRN